MQARLASALGTLLEGLCHFGQAGLWDSSRRFPGACPSRSPPLKSRCFQESVSAWAEDRGEVARMTAMDSGLWWSWVQIPARPRPTRRPQRRHPDGGGDNRASLRAWPRGPSAHPSSRHTSAAHCDVGGPLRSGAADSASTSMRPSAPQCLTPMSLCDCPLGPQFPKKLLVGQLSIHFPPSRS